MSTYDEFSGAPTSNVDTSQLAGGGVEQIFCRICHLLQLSTDEYRQHLHDSHYELLTNDELNGIVTVGGEAVGGGGGGGTTSGGGGGE